MKLLKFPLLVQEQILKSMGYRQLFFLSFASNRTKQLIQLFKFNLISFLFLFYRYGVKVYFQDNDFKKYVICLILNRRLEGYAGEVCDIAWGEDRYPDPMTFTRKKDDSDLLLDIHKHIFELFSKSQYFHFTALVTDIKAYRYVPRVTKLGFMEETVKVEDVEELVRMHSDLQALIVFKDLVGDISPESNIFQLKVLTVQYPSRPFTNFTDHYKGRFAIFCDQKKEDAQLFLEKWLKKECCENLEHVWIFLPTGQRFNNRFLENFGDKRWDINTMPEMYPYAKEDAYYAGVRPNLFTCNGSYYAERFDGKVAVVRLYNSSMLFSVWDQRPW